MEVFLNGTSYNQSIKRISFNPVENAKVLLYTSRYPMLRILSNIPHFGGIQRRFISPEKLLFSFFDRARDSAYGNYTFPSS